MFINHVFMCSYYTAPTIAPTEHPYPTLAPTEPPYIPPNQSSSSALSPFTLLYLLFGLIGINSHSNVMLVLCLSMLVLSFSSGVEGMCGLILYCIQYHFTHIKITAGDGSYSICAFCSGTCEGATVCKSYVTDQCIPVYNHCSGELIYYGIFSDNNNEYSANLYQDSQCADNNNVQSFSTTCDTCIPLMNAQAQCLSSSTIILPLIFVIVLLLLPLLN